jgi:molybdopterin-dependent oxidoreductase alpha subunit
MGAIRATLTHSAREVGIFKSIVTLLKTNQPDGFDCPGCAWPEHEKRARIEFCENGAKHIASEATKHRVAPAFFERWSIPELLEQPDRWLESQGRLTHPMVRRPGSDRYEPIAWDDAFALVAEQLNALASPNEALFYTSGRASNEAAFLYQLLARQLGTNNLPDCSNLCHESSGKGLTTVIGTGKGTVGLDDFELADAIFIIGQNPGTNHPRMLTTLQAAAKRGCRIVSINPLREPGLVRFKHPQKPLDLLGRGTTISERYLQVRINGDVALLKGIMKAVLEAEREQPGQVLDHAFIETHTTGFDAFADALEQIDWDLITRESGIDRAAIQQTADIYIASERTIVCWAMGLTQHKNAVANIQEVVNLLLLKGNLGKPGAGACPVRGHSNVQGDRTMGIWEAPSAQFLKRLGDALGFEPPTKHGHNAVSAITAMSDGSARIFIALGGNFVAASPDTELTTAALQTCDLTVQISTKLNRSHLVTGKQALILPCLARSEIDHQISGPQFVSMENSMSIVHRSRGHRTPPSEELRSEPAIIAGIAHETLGDRSVVDWHGVVENYDLIRDLIEKSIAGFDDYNQRVRETGGFLLPNSVRERSFKTDSGKARFTVHDITPIPLADGEYLMMTIRSHDQYNTTVYSNDDRYRGVFGDRRVVFMNADDIAAGGLCSGQLVDLVGSFNGTTRRAERFTIVAFDLPRRCAATYFPEANVLIPVDSVADISHTPTSKSVVIRITAVAV